jgi:hypothetical protein
MPFRSPIATTIAIALAVTGVSCKSVSPEALPAAQAWLALVDDGKYAESWTDSASIFQAATDSPAWERQVKAVRGPLGKVQSRTLKTSVAATSLPGVPDGEYVVFMFDTSFEHKPGAIETVTPMKDKDGRWKVSGYYVK